MNTAKEDGGTKQKAYTYEEGEEKGYGDERVGGWAREGGNHQSFVVR